MVVLCCSEYEQVSPSLHQKSEDFIQHFQLESRMRCWLEWMFPVTVTVFITCVRFYLSCFYFILVCLFVSDSGSTAARAGGRPDGQEVGARREEVGRRLLRHATFFFFPSFFFPSLFFGADVFLCLKHLAYSSRVWSRHYVPIHQSLWTPPIPTHPPTLPPSSSDLPSHTHTHIPQ